MWDDPGFIQFADRIARQGGPVSLVTVEFSVDTDRGGDLTGYYRPILLISLWFNSVPGQGYPMVIL